jgi:hypothetical protein
LDIRLPFVAFRGSIIEVLKQTGIRSAVGEVRSPQIMLKTLSARHPHRRFSSLDRRMSREDAASGVDFDIRYPSGRESGRRMSNPKLH